MSTMAKTLNRRQMLVGAAALGGAMTISVTSPELSRQAQAGYRLRQATPAPTDDGSYEFAARLTINSDNSITVRGTKPEAGQGTSTTLVVFVCEELGCDPLDLEMVRMEWADPRRDVIDNNAYLGEMDAFHTYFYGRADWVRPLYQQAGASARERLKRAAAAEWDVPSEEITVKNNMVIHEASGQSLGFGALVEAAASIVLDEEPAIHEPDEWVLIGKPHRKRETPAKVSGKAEFGIDVTLPGMIYGAVAQSPVRGGKLKSFDADAIKDMPGVHSVVPAPDFATSSIVVLADSYWRARTALEAMPIEWEGGATDLSIEDIAEQHSSKLDEAGIEVENTGDAIGVLEAADKVYEAVYQTPYRTHSALEPRNATAIFTPERVDIWNGGASHDSPASLISMILQIPPEQIHTHGVYVGGSFGPGRIGTDAVLAVIAAMTVPGTPVKLIWTREEHTRQAMFDPYGTAKFQMSVDADGWPEAFFIRKVSQKWYIPPPRGPEEADSTGLRWMLTDTNLANPTLVAPDLTPEKREELLAIYYDGLAYRFPNYRIEYHNVDTPVPVSAMRSPGLSSNVFMLESFIDEVAFEEGKDPLELRRRLLKTVNDQDPGWIRVLDLAAEKAEWGKELPKGTGQGIAICAEHGTICAVVAQVSVTPAGDLTVDKVDIAFDAGYILNPDGAANQLEGATLFGWSMALNEEITMQNGEWVELNFDSYPLARMMDAPHELTVHFEATSAYRPDAALGEATVPHMAAAVGNAIFAATGNRVRSLPFRKADLAWS